MVEEKAPVATLGTEIGCDGDSLASTVDEVQRGGHAESGGTKGGARQRSAPFIATVMGEDGGSAAATWRKEGGAWHDVAGGGGGPGPDRRLAAARLQVARAAARTGDAG
jgi:hypothetical protein